MNKTDQTSMNDRLLDALVAMCEQHCATRVGTEDYNGQVAGSKVTDSGALTASAEALYLLEEHGRFRIVASGGRMVVGYWPENDPGREPCPDKPHQRLAQ